MTKNQFLKNYSTIYHFKRRILSFIVGLRERGVLVENLETFFKCVGVSKIRV